MPDWPTLIPLAVSVVAVVVSALALFLAGRREDKRWKREVLVETMVSFFDASYAYVDRGAFRTAKARGDLEWYRDRALDAHAAQFRALTRLQFLARRRVVKRAIELHNIEDQLFELVFRGLPNEETFEELETKRSKARIKLFNASRRNLGLWWTSKKGLTPGTGPKSEEMASHVMKRQQQEREIKSAQTTAEQVPDTQTVKVSRGWRLFRGRAAKELQRE